MRGPELGLPETATDNFLARSKPPEPPPAESGRLQQRGREFVAPDSQVPAVRVLWSPNLFWSSSNS